MTPRRSPLLLVVVAATGCGGDARSSSGFADVRHLPADATLVARVDVKALRAAAAYARFEPLWQREAGQGLSLVQATCGLAPLERVQQATIGLASPGPDGPTRGTIVVRGLAPAEVLACVRKLAPLAADRGIAVDVRADRVVAHDDEGSAAIGFAGDAAVVVFAATPVVEAELDAALRGDAGRLADPAYRRLLEFLPTDGTLWATIEGHAWDLVPAMFASSVGPEALVGLGVEVGADVRLHGRLRLDTAARAGNVAALAGPLLKAAGRAQRADLRADGRALRLELVLTADQLESVATQFLQRMGR